ncbi:MAG: hypothetical protein ACREJD_10610 [Phycisphaerales bacterium]
MIAIGTALILVMPRWLMATLITGAAIAMWWILGSLIISHWIYDRSSLYRWNWIPRFIGSDIGRWINVHAGLDESTLAIRAAVRSDPIAVLDIFDPSEMTEPSIARARRDGIVPWPPVVWRGTDVPLEFEKIDVAFAVFCLHEIRKDEARSVLMRSLTSCLRSGGKIVVVEHMRDLANFAAFGPGFMHFLPMRRWKQTFDHAGLILEKHERITPFVRVISLKAAT